MWWRTPTTWYAQQNPQGAWSRLTGLRRTLSVRYLRPPREWRPRLVRRFSARLEPGVTIVTVSFNSIHYLPATVEMVRRHTDPSVRLIVVDNCSTDGTREWIVSQGLDALLLQRNLDHGLALNLGWTRSRTRYTVALDVDAFPIADGWLEPLIAPLAEGYRVSGAFQDLPWGYGRGFVHPCWLAMETSRFFRRGHTFEEGRNWDVGELISWREYPALHLIAMTSLHGPGWLGQVYGQLLYHNGYSTMSFRMSRGERGILHREDEIRNIDGITRDEPLEMWRDALRRYGRDVSRTVMAGEIGSVRDPAGRRGRAPGSATPLVSDGGEPFDHGSEVPHGRLGHGHPRDAVGGSMGQEVGHDLVRGPDEEVRRLQHLGP